MSTTTRRLSIVAATLAVAAVVAVLLVIRARGDGSSGKVWGTPRAESFETTNTSGPLVARDAVTFLPNIAELKPGNRTHNVRLDIVAPEIEIAPGVRYQAWTFGGSVPGPVPHAAILVELVPYDGGHRTHGVRAGSYAGLPQERGPMHTQEVSCGSCWSSL